MAFKVKLPRRPQNRSRATTRTIRKLFIFRKYGRVGKTRHSIRRRDIKRKHPHRRGEDQAMRKLTTFLLETPPQAWGRRPHARPDYQQERNTPTGVGKTRPSAVLAVELAKHPHRRGEDRFALYISEFWKETPPQAWGRLYNFAVGINTLGNTPTGVGKTYGITAHAYLRGKHPHRRGEDAAGIPGRFALAETPPQAWGRLFILLKRINRL